MLIKNRIDKYVLEDALMESSITDSLRHKLTREYADLDDARQVLAQFKSCCPTGGLDELIIEEFKEICKDLRWSKSKRGALVSECNDLVPGLYREIRDEMGNEDVVKGAHTDRLAVVIAGSVSSSERKDAVLRHLQGRFAYPIIDKLTVSQPPTPFP